MDARRGEADQKMIDGGGWMDVITVIMGRDAKKRLTPNANPWDDPLMSN